MSIERFDDERDKRCNCLIMPISERLSDGTYLGAFVVGNSCYHECLARAKEMHARKVAGEIHDHP